MQDNNNIFVAKGFETTVYTEDLRRLGWKCSNCWTFTPGQYVDERLSEDEILPVCSLCNETVVSADGAYRDCWSSMEVRFSLESGTTEVLASPNEIDHEGKMNNEFTTKIGKAPFSLWCVPSLNLQPIS